MADTILRHSKHLREFDMGLLDKETQRKMLNNKFVMRTLDNKDQNSIIEDYFMWLRDNCEHFYHVSGSVRDQNDILYYIYFESDTEAKLFKLTF